ncbi:hypothetical protein [Micromonospora chalcea]|uniref:hypothetical protein n=1 Tax=Micromonospora chalcea TaxID=1874 RepID=UPI003D70ABCA
MQIDVRDSEGEIAGRLLNALVWFVAEIEKADGSSFDVELRGCHVIDGRRALGFRYVDGNAGPHGEILYLDLDRIAAVRPH